MIEAKMILKYPNQRTLAIVYNCHTFYRKWWYSNRDWFPISPIWFLSISKLQWILRGRSKAVEERARWNEIIPGSTAHRIILCLAFRVLSRASFRNYWSCILDRNDAWFYTRWGLMYSNWRDRKISRARLIIFKHARSMISALEYASG